MKITLVPSSIPTPGGLSSQYLTSFVLNDAVAIDAGSLGFYREPHEQATIDHVFISHSHIDHLASLPIFLENIVGLGPTPVTIHSSAIVQQSLRQDLFNDRIWPNFLELKVNNRPFLALATIESGDTVEVAGLRITAVGVDHVVPTLGFIIEDQHAAIVIASDTAPTEAIWAKARQTPNVKAAFLEATFPDDMTRLAEISKHITPAQYGHEMQKLPGVTFYAVHLKARFREKVAQELLSQGHERLELADFGTMYEF